MCHYCDLMSNSEFKVKVLDPRAKIPSKREEDSGYDIYGIIEKDCLIIPPGNSEIIGTGLAMELPKGLGFVICNRSSLGTKAAVVGAHVVDSGYRGEVKIDLHNISNNYILITDMGLGEVKKIMEDELMPYQLIRDVFYRYEPRLIKKSNALTQGLILPTLHIPVRVVEELSDSDRKDGAFGSTDKKIPN